MDALVFGTLNDKKVGQHQVLHVTHMPPMALTNIPPCPSATSRY